jgi:hypothetical protein
LLVALACAACAEIGDDPYDPALDEEDAAARLPEPAVWRVPPPALSAEAQRRQFEVDRYIREQLYTGYRIAETTQTYSGDIIDWVDPASVPGSQIEPPPPISADHLATPDGVELQRTDLDEYPELRGPAGSIPIVRPDFAAYVRGSSGDLSLADHLARQQPGVWGVYRYFAGWRQTIQNTGVDAFINQSINQVEAGTFSVMEELTQCDGPTPSTTIELVGAAVSKDLANFSDSVLRLRVEFLTAGYSMGNNVGGWDGTVIGFIPAAGRPYGPNAAVTPSTPGGTQRESHFRIENYYGNWWVAHNGNWLGYYPGYLFDLMHYQGCTARWYGEVYDPTPQSWTWTDIGSGYYPSVGYKWAATFRNPFYMVGANAYWPGSVSEVLPKNDSCYTKSAITTAASPWDRYFYLGGPGSPALGCN